MSKWLKKELFDKFKENKKNEVDDVKDDGGFYLKWRNPEKGTQDKPKTYRVRFVPDKDGNFYKKYHYHMFKSGDKWCFILCPKTYGMDNFCPWCSVTSKLYTGDKEDKAKASNYKRKERFVGNVFIVEDPRDNEQSDESRKVANTLRLYEFPQVIESKLKNEITDDAEGYGMKIFDPENGHDFLIKVKSKKPDARGKVWPDYNDSLFARSPSAIAETEKEIEKVMDERYSLDDYLTSLAWTNDKHKDLIEVEMLWDIVKDDFKKYWDIETEIESHNDSNNMDEAFAKKELSDSDEPSTDEQSTDEPSNDELMDRLKNL